LQLQSQSLQIAESSHTISIKFDQLFDQFSQQSEVFEAIKHPLQLTFKGYNFSIVAYGQTGSGIFSLVNVVGKTYTMFGFD